MTKQVQVAAADPGPGQERPEAIIAIRGALPTFSGASVPASETLRKHAKFYDQQASLLWDAPKNTLPGGTLDALLRIHLSSKASLFRVRGYSKN